MPTYNKEDATLEMANNIQAHWKVEEVYQQSQRVYLTIKCLFCNAKHSERFSEQECPVYLTGAKQSCVIETAQGVKHSELCVVAIADHYVVEAIDDLFGSPPDDLREPDAMTQIPEPQDEEYAARLRELQSFANCLDRDDQYKGLFHD